MNPTRTALRSVFVLALATLPLTAGVIVDVDGFHCCAFLIQDSSWRWAASWTSANTYPDVSIYLQAGSGAGEAYLTTRIGPGTTIADQISAVGVTGPAVPGWVLLMEHLSLGPGTYYLTMAAGIAESGFGIATCRRTDATCLVTTAPGVILNDSLDVDAAFSGPLDPYPPATAFRVVAEAIFFRVESKDSVPEPATFAPLAAGLLALGVARRRR